MARNPSILDSSDHPLVLGANDQPVVLRRINRRLVLQAGAAATGLLILPFRAWPFSQSVTGLRKYVITLPGLGPQNAAKLVANGKLFNGGASFLPVLSPSPVKIGAQVGDMYSITAQEFQQLLHPDLPQPATFWGYSGTSVDHKTGKPVDAGSHYLGGVIVAHKDRPVRVQLTNDLPNRHILPVDVTLVDPVVLAETGLRQDRATLHLHGALVFWDSDGSPFTWFSSNRTDFGATGFVHGSSFVNPGPTPGTAIYNYPNQLSARLHWYHDHAYSLTRINVYAGLASAYLLTDESEAALIKSGTIPGAGLSIEDGRLGIPLILQDKTFWDENQGDPGYSTVPPAGAHPGSLWYPHVYEGGLDPTGLPAMSPINPSTDTLTARWGWNPANMAPSPSTVPEFFSDTLVINGAPYPVATVPNGRVRFRILNASNSRFYNLQLYAADGSVDGITLAADTAGTLDNNGNVIFRPTNAAGPAFIQIGNESGFLPQPMVFSTTSTVDAIGQVTSGDGSDNHNSNRVMQYKLAATAATTTSGQTRTADSGTTRSFGSELLTLPLAPGDPTIGNALSFNLMLAPGERADVIIDFRDSKGDNNGKSFILYNDAPAPFPVGDVRNDYYVRADMDLRSIGGVGPTPAGQNPDTRVMMKFNVSGKANPKEPDFATTVKLLQAQLPKVFAARGDAPLDLAKARTLVKSLGEDNGDGFGRLRQYLSDANFSTPQPFAEFPGDVANVGETQIWQIYNTTGDTHPIHLHLVQVKLIQRDQWNFDANGLPVLADGVTSGLSIKPGTTRQPDPNEQGWKETIRMNPGEVTTIAMNFALPTGTQPPNSPRLKASFGIDGGEWVWHCHILEHEEHDMMHPLVVMGTMPGATTPTPPSPPHKPEKPEKPQPEKPQNPGKP